MHPSPRSSVTCVTHEARVEHGAWDVGGAWGGRDAGGARAAGTRAGPGPGPGHSVLVNSMMAMVIMTRPISATMPRERPRGTVQPPQDTPGASLCRAAGLMLRWLNTARRMGSTM